MSSLDLHKKNAIIERLQSAEDRATLLLAAAFDPNTPAFFRNELQDILSSVLMTSFSALNTDNVALCHVSYNDIAIANSLGLSVKEVADLMLQLQAKHEGVRFEEPLANQGCTGVKRVNQYAIGDR